MDVSSVIEEKALYSLIDDKDYDSETIVVNEKCSGCKKAMSFPYKQERVLDGDYGYLGVGDDSIVVLRGKCPKCEEPHYSVFAKTEEGLESIGFFPGVLVLDNRALEYSNVLTDNQLSDFTMAIKSHSLGLNVASFVYFRRLLESLVVKILEDNDVDCSSLKSFKDKLSKAEEFVPLFEDDFKDVKIAFYGFISEGVHKWTEVECGRQYGIAFYAITRVLDHYKAEKENEEKTSELKNAIGKFTSSKGKKK